MKNYSILTSKGEVERKEWEQNLGWRNKMNLLWRNKMCVCDNYKQYESIVKNAPEYGAIETSLSGEFVAYTSLCGKLMLGKNEIATYFPIAIITPSFEIEGLMGNSGTDRFKRLSRLEKMDIGTLLTKLLNK